jgi:hypothetical protein
LKEIAVLMTACWVATQANAEETVAPVDDDNDIAISEIDQQNPDSKTKAKDSLGLEFTSANEKFSINPWLRGQFRFSDPFDSDPRTMQEFADEPGSDLEVRRARLKVEGYLFGPRLGFYYEHELSGDHPLLDLRLDIELDEDLQLRIGQHKVLYNRERVDSSGKQQFVERSISTYAFTVDRQVGITAAKRFAAGTTLDNWLMAGINKGTGRGGLNEDGGDPMVLVRWQWQFLGRALPFSQSDLKFRQKPAASLAIATARVRGPYTRYSSSGGGQLDGFDSGGDERYTLRQYLQEFAWHFDGMSIQQEYHVKQIRDHESGADSTLRGGYAQFGKLWEIHRRDHNLGIEGAIRIARVDWDTPEPDRVQDEITLVSNLFIRGHNNKVTAEVSQIRLDSEQTGKDKDVRFRLQWDVSF